MTKPNSLARLAAAYDSGGLVGMRNRIINGAMMIDQRNAGAAVTISGTQSYFTDRFSINCTGSITGQQVVDAPTGFVYSLKGTVNASTLRASVFHRFEANNLSDAISGAVTLSFWAKSSQTGIRSANYTLTDASNVGKISYIVEFNITAANTWQQFSFPIPAPTTLTGVNTYGNSVCSQLTFIFSKDGSPAVKTVGSWDSSTQDIYGVSANQIAMTSGGTFNITGVQLEKGSTATSFDYRPYGTELALCQRYYQFGTNRMVKQNCDTLRNTYDPTNFPMTMRTVPTLTNSNTSSSNVGTANVAMPSANGFSFLWNSTNTTDFQNTFNWTASAEL